MDIPTERRRMGVRRLSALALLIPLLATTHATGQPTIYWSNTYAGSLQRTVIGTEVIEALVEGFVDRPHSLRLDLDAGKIYWALNIESPLPNNAVLQRADLDGSTLDNLVLSGACNPICPVSAMTLDTERDSLYWFTWDGQFPATHTLHRSDLTGSDVTVLGISDHVVLDVELDRASETLYWLDSRLPGSLADHAINRATLSGSSSEQLLLVFDGRPPGQGQLAVDRIRQKVYWLTDTRAVRRANLDGSEVEDLVTIDGEPDSTRFGDIVLDISNGKMYWSVTYGGVKTFPKGVIHRANLDGSGIEELVRLEPGSIGAIAIDFSGIVGREGFDPDPHTFSLGAAYPNPSSAVATIPFTVEEAGTVTITLFDLLGRRVWVESSGPVAQGPHELKVPTKELPRGLYLYRLESAGATAARTLVVQH